jgi:hypothetical protein
MFKKINELCLLLFACLVYSSYMETLICICIYVLLGTSIIIEGIRTCRTLMYFFQHDLGPAWIVGEIYVP